MLEVTLSEHYQIPIPKEICDSLHIKAGQRFSIVFKDNTISLVPTPTIQTLRGILKGANTENVRDRSERVWKC